MEGSEDWEAFGKIGKPGKRRGDLPGLSQALIGSCLSPERDLPQWSEVLALT